MYRNILIKEFDLTTRQGSIKTTLIVSLAFDVENRPIGDKLVDVMNILLEPHIKEYTNKYNCVDEMDRFENNEGTGWIYKLTFRSIDDVIQFAYDLDLEIDMTDVFLFVQDGNVFDDAVFEATRTDYYTENNVDFNNLQNVSMPETLKDENDIRKVNDFLNSISDKIKGYEVLRNLKND